MASEDSPQKLQLLEKLAEELLKNSPKESVIVTCMREAGLKDTGDPVDRINKVLQALHFEEEDKEFAE